MFSKALMSMPNATAKTFNAFFIFCCFFAKSSSLLFIDSYAASCLSASVAIAVIVPVEYFLVCQVLNPPPRRRFSRYSQLNLPSRLCSRHFGRTIFDYAGFLNPPAQRCRSHCNCQRTKCVYLKI